MATKTIDCDVVIAGCGVAGLYCALNLPRALNVVLLSKEDVASCDSMLAQGGICVLHAAANAIPTIARSGNNSDGATLYVTDSPCIECAKLIIQAGIRRVVYARSYRLTDGLDLLLKAGISVEKVELEELNDSTSAAH